MSNEVPKLFISYSWSSPTHEEWVLELATQLADAGVKVILDKWDLREGHDSIAFMEQMVTNPEIKKVIMVCDRTYMEKTNKRDGGVGTEAQIISPQLYSKTADQGKFVAVIAEKDDAGKPYLPVYYQSRIYIDLADPDFRQANLEKLIRWIYDKQVHIRPELGKRPSYLDSPNVITLGGSDRYSRAIDAIRNDKGYAIAAVREYFDTVIENIGRFTIAKAEPTTVDDLVLERIDQFQSSRSEIVGILNVLVQYRDTQESRSIAHKFFERLITTMDRQVNQPGSWLDSQFDNMKFVVHELFLNFMAILIRYEKFEFANFMLEERYFVPNGGTSNLTTYEEFRQHARSLDRISQKNGRASSRADLLESNSRNSVVPFDYLKQADLVIFTRAVVNDAYWYPESLLYATFGNTGPMEIFARAESRRYFERIDPMIGVKSKEMLESIGAKLRANPDQLPRWNHHRLPWEGLINLRKIASAP